MAPSQRAKFDHRARQSGERNDRESLAERVEMVRGMDVKIGGNGANGQPHADCAQRNIHQKNAAPAHAGDQQAAGHGSRSDGYAAGGGPQPHRTRPQAVIAGCRLVEQRKGTSGINRAAATPLRSAGGNQRRHIRSQSATPETPRRRWPSPREKRGVNRSDRPAPPAESIRTANGSV